jgi:hypothetical protein
LGQREEQLKGNKKIMTIVETKNSIHGNNDGVEEQKYNLTLELVEKIITHETKHGTKENIF